MTKTCCSQINKYIKLKIYIYIFLKRAKPAGKFSPPPCFSSSISGCIVQRRILVPRPGTRIELMPTRVEVGSLNHWTTREVPTAVFPAKGREELWV